MTVNPLTDRVWVAEYMPGVRAEANTAAYASLVDLFEHACERFRTLTAFEHAGATLSYAELDQRAAALASFLQRECGLRHGERVAIMLPNIVQYPVTLFGILRAGMVAVNIDPRLDPQELERQLNDCGARAIVVFDGFCGALQTVIERTAIDYVVMAETGATTPPLRRVLTAARHSGKAAPAPTLKGAIPFRIALAQGERNPHHPAVLGSSELALLHYTSGTTGLARAAMLTHGNLVANVMQSHAMFASRLAEGAEVVVTAQPLHDLFALTLSSLLFVMLGARNLLADADDAAALLHVLGKSRVTVFSGSGMLFDKLLAAPDFGDVNFESLKLIVGSGAIAPTVAENWRLATGVAITPVYGLVEASPVVCGRPPPQQDWDGTVGVPLPSTLVSVRDDDNEPVPLGLCGELCVKGPQVMKGYWGKPEDTARAMTPDGFLRTGDLATMSENSRVTLIDRKQDLISVPGHEVVPNEIESMLALHPGVREAACVGVADGKAGLLLKAFVVRSDPALNAAALQAFCRRNLPAYKVPALVEFRESLPKSAAGIILRRALR